MKLVASKEDKAKEVRSVCNSTCSLERSERPKPTWNTVPFIGKVRHTALGLVSYVVDRGSRICPFYQCDMQASNHCRGHHVAFKPNCGLASASQTHLAEHPRPIAETLLCSKISKGLSSYPPILVSRPFRRDSNDGLDQLPNQTKAASCKVSYSRLLSNINKGLQMII